MKGIVLSLGLPRKQRFRLPAVRPLLRRHGVTLVMATLLLTGLVLGAAYARFADKQTLHALDFLFTTNLEARLSKGAPGIFCACFASDFIFLLCAYLLGVAAWGMPVVPLLVCFKGFGTGVTAGYLCLSHGLSGAGFYLLVLLPGTCLFCAVLVRFSAVAFRFSRRVFSHTCGKQMPPVSLKDALLRFSARFLSALGIACIASLLDTVLWTLFAGTFQF